MGYHCPSCCCAFHELQETEWSHTLNWSYL
jgi:hypothetical protein